MDLLDKCAAPLGDLLAMVQQQLCLLLGQLIRFTLNLVRQGVMRLLLMGDLLWQGSPISLRREPTTQLGRHQILMWCLPWRRLAGHCPLTAPPPALPTVIVESLVGVVNPPPSAPSGWGCSHWRVKSAIAVA